MNDAYPPMPLPRRNYFNDAKDSADGLRYRLGGEDVVRRIIDQLSGVARDKYGKIIEGDDKRKYRLMNEEGLYRAELFLQGALTKITHLTKYKNEERVNIQMIELAQMWAFEITLHRKQWEVKDKDLVQQIVEKAIYEAMLRSQDGFENSNISKSWNVNENIDLQAQQQQRRFLGFFGGGNRG